MVAVLTSEIDRAINRSTIEQEHDLDEIIGIVALHVPMCRVQVTAQAPRKTIDRAALKAELQAIRKRETEILEILLAD